MGQPAVGLLRVFRIGRTGVPVQRAELGQVWLRNMSALIVAATAFLAHSPTVMLVYSQANCQGLLLWGMQVEGQLAMFASRLRMHAPGAANALTAMASDAGIADFTTASEGGLSSAYTTGIRLSHVQTYAVPLPRLAGAHACIICCSSFVMSLLIASVFFAHM